MRATRIRWRPVALAGAVAGSVVLAPACAGTSDTALPLPPTTTRVGNTDVSTYQLVCPSPVGDLSTAIEFSVTDSLEHLVTGEKVTYSITAPLAQVKSPVTPTFESSTTTYAIPAGLQVDSARLDPTSNADFPTTSTKVEADSVSFTLNGNFPLDGTTRNVPTLVIDVTVTATAGQDVEWRTPTSIVGAASVPLLGSQSSTCSFPTSGPIGTTNVT